MRKLMLLLFGVVLGGGLMYAAFHYHVVRTQEEWLFVPKRQLSLDKVYVDVRSWTVRDWSAHPELVEALAAHGRGDVVVPVDRLPRHVPRFGHADGDPQPRRE